MNEITDALRRAFAAGENTVVVRLEPLAELKLEANRAEAARQHLARWMDSGDEQQVMDAIECLRRP